MKSVITTALLCLVSIYALAVVSPISGAGTVCAGYSISLSDATTGGNWTSSSPAVATVNFNSGVVTGITGGTSIITYRVGTNYVTSTITVQPVVTPITGSNNVCIGSTVTLGESTTGGTWSMLHTKATIAAGVITGVTAGFDTVLYTLTNSCGTVTAKLPITINPLPTVGAITGDSIVCAGAAITLSNSVSGGAWSKSGPAANVSSTGIVTGVVGGTDTIKYKVTSANCGFVIATKVITINTTPTASAISGSNFVCIGSSVTLADASTGGVWSVRNAKATVSVSGVVTGLVSGTDTVTYTVSNTCGPTKVSKIVTIYANPDSGTISGTDNVCVGAIITLAESVSGGVWSRTNTHATIASTGIVHGLSAGIDTIKYSVSSAHCGTAIRQMQITVNPLPTVGAITGNINPCIGANLTYSDANTGGTWSISNSRATIGSSTGILTGVSAGTDTISYSITNLCGTTVKILNINVRAMPDAGIITGALSTICVGDTITLSNTVTGGSWSKVNPKVNLSNAGFVTGVLTGVDTIRYRVTTTYCGADTAIYPMTVNPLPVSGTIYALSAVICSATPVTFSESVTGGTWSSSNASVATVSTGGVVTALVAGTDTISYSVTNSCGTAYSKKVITANMSPNKGVITLASEVCAGDTILISESVTGGSYISSNASAAFYSGKVIGKKQGIDTIFYRVATAYCGADTAVAYLNINRSPDAGKISGTSSLICVSKTTTLAETVTGGVWESVNTGLASVSTGGVVTAHNAGIDTILYISTTSKCGSDTAKFKITIDTCVTEVKDLVNAEALSIKLSPNPTSQELKIELGNVLFPVQMEIFNLLGQKIQTEELIENRTKIGVSNLAKGCYFVVIYRDGIKIAYAKFVKN